ncbi:LOW QUALITY PROTEIN: phosphatidylserine decarboxylase proenzyme 1, mitochondrial [Argentina anserina]|uniref:LOW QUALITY PROTEIN: phosphatidylserine decarboxylase proenzyme 1, mitochondrial n=1 Tax=Argentina anserina TaxID=57926 RepID=UPI0021769053|nr:LOW QUALITY PROTEIN: phosphatidylserine decarboxylase proenzyme 1, mitochondrial [Potentilla anserina]
MAQVAAPKAGEAHEKGIEFEFQPDVRSSFLRSLPLRAISRCWGVLTSVEIPVSLRSHVYRAWARAFHSKFTSSSRDQNIENHQFIIQHSNKLSNKAVLTIHVSTATTERAFSVMNIIKNKLRIKMRDEFLGDCMVLHIEKEYAESIGNDEFSRHQVVLEGLWQEGFMALAAVGATNIGSIELSIEPVLQTNQTRKKLLHSERPEERLYEPDGVGRTLKKGDEVAAFNMGSTVVLVFQAPISLSPENGESSSDFKFLVQDQ